MSNSPVQRAKQKKRPTGMYAATYIMSTSQQIAAQYLKQLDKTPKWRVLKRSGLKKKINFWGRQG